MASGFSQAQRDIGQRLTALAKSHNDPREIMGRLGKLAREDADKAAKADLGGDNKFSGWARAPLTTETRYLGKGQQYVGPTARSAGPWTVAQQGRNQGNASGFAGPGINRRTGLTARTKAGNVRKVRAVGPRRWNGRTVGKGTATTAKATTARETPERLKKISREVLVKAFRTGR